MAQTPSASTTVQATAGRPSSGADLICLLAPCSQNADYVPRLFGSAAAIYAQHGYSEALEYAAFHMQETGKSVLLVGMPIDTAGVIGRKTTVGNTGTCVVNVTAGGSGVLGEHDGIVKVAKGGTIGTDQIMLDVSLDGGFTYRKMRLGTASSLALPYVNATLAFAAGTLVAGDTVLQWHGSGPRSSSVQWALARTALATQMKLFRSAMLFGDIQNDTEGSAFADQIDAYASENDRFTVARASVPDRLPYATMSHVIARMTGSPTLSFAEVGATADTITRSTGSWITDGFAVGDVIAVTGAVNSNNNETAAKIVTLSATVITLDTEDLDVEVATAGCTVTATPRLTFAEVGATGDTITRSRGSWLDDGFRVGDIITVSGTVSNNFVGASTVTAVTATVLTLNTDDLAAEVIGSYAVTITAGQTKAVWAAAQELEFEPVTTRMRVNLGLGRGRKTHPFSGWYHRRSVEWAASLREYRNDIHVTTWRKDQGNTGWDLNDTSNNLVEYDDRVDGGAASAARFTSFRTWGNGPAGAYISRDLTRDADGSVLSNHHNVNVVNTVCTVTQYTTENAIGRTPELNDDGTMTDAERSNLEGEVNAELTRELLQDKKGQGKRCSSVRWTASADDDLSVDDATVTGVAEVDLNGTIVNISTTVRVNSSAA